MVRLFCGGSRGRLQNGRTGGWIHIPLVAIAWASLVLCQPVRGQAGCEPIISGQTKSGDLVGSSTRAYCFDAKAGQAVVIELADLSSAGNLKTKDCTLRPDRLPRS